MTSISSLSLSGMNAAMTTLGSAAHNIANLGTPAFRRQQVVQTEQPGGGVDTTLTQATEPGEALAADVVNQLQAKNAFLANLAVFRTSDRMLGSLLDATG
ncbi:MAG: flagellar basal body rod protein [Burkholderiales bacterium]